jgi:hypothetical protein
VSRIVARPIGLPVAEVGHNTTPVAPPQLEGTLGRETVIGGYQPFAAPARETGGFECELHQFVQFLGFEQFQVPSSFHVSLYHLCWIFHPEAHAAVRGILLDISPARNS